MKKLFIILGIIIITLILIVLVTNIIYDGNTDLGKTRYDYDCCPQGPYFQAPCACEDDVNILQKTIIVLSGKLI